MPTAFITGGAGFIGSSVARQAVSTGYEVVIYDTFKQYLIPEPDAEQHNPLVRVADIFDQITVIRGDTLNKDMLRRTLNRFKPDVIIHMAALPLASVAIEHTEDAYDSILNSTVNILEVVRDFDHECSVLYTSSSMVYGDFASAEVTEEAPKDPKDIYGSLKYAGEIICRGYMKRYDIDLRIVRPTAVYGPYDANARVLYKFIRQALAGEPLTVDGDGSSKLDFTYVQDTARGIFLAATGSGGSSETFNIARGRARSLKEAVDIIENLVGGVEVTYGPPPPHMPDRGTLDVTRASELLGFSPEYDLENGLEIYVDHLKANRI
jgi:UDP-glucose 4-epimerase